MNRDEQIIRKSLAEIFKKATQNDLNRLFHELRTAYGEKHRGHHTLEHIADMLREAEDFPLHDRIAFKAAILYHDFVYDVKNYGTENSNEKLSAQACQRILNRYGIGNGIAVRVTSLIRMTEKHEVPEDDAEAALFMDIDMAVLGASRERYRRYCMGIAREFVPTLGAEAYLIGRREFLEGQIAKEHIFKTDHYAHLHEQARENAQYELTILEHIASWATPSKDEDIPAYHK